MSAKLIQVDYEKLSTRGRAVAECLVLANQFDVLSEHPAEPYPHALKHELIDRWMELAEGERAAIIDLRSGAGTRWAEWIWSHVATAVSDLPVLAQLEKQLAGRGQNCKCHSYPWCRRT